MFVIVVRTSTSYLIIEQIRCLHGHRPVENSRFTLITLQSQRLHVLFERLRLQSLVDVLVSPFTVPPVRCRIGIMIPIVLDPSKDLLLLLLFFRFLPKPSFRGIRDIERMVPGRIAVVTASFNNEGVTLPPFHRYFGNEEIVDVPGDSPRRVFGEGGVASFAASRPDFRREGVLT